ncbi:MAG: glycosyltransferase [Clostridiales bacterium]|nr:glycosyltransferase [Clostridiales bacterium]
MKKILQVVSCLALGGTEAFIMSNYRQLDKSKYQFDFMIFVEYDSPYVREIEALGGKVFYCGLPAITRLKEFENTVISIIRENGPYDAVHSHVNIQNGFVMQAAYRAGVKQRISHSHDTSGKGAVGVKYLTERWKEYLIKHYATDFLACSSAAGCYLYGQSLFSEKGKMIPNGIDLRPFCEAGARRNDLLKEFDIPQGCNLIVGNITRFEPKKNPIYTVKVFKELLTHYPDAILLLGGPDGGQLNEIRELVKALDISAHVRFIGSRRDIPDCLELIDVYVFPSLYEGLGIGFLEAQASACLCVASKGVSEEASIVETSTVYLSLEDTPTVWAEHIAEKLETWKKPDCEYIKTWFEKKGFEIESSHKKLIEVYDGVN